MNRRGQLERDHWYWISALNDIRFHWNLAAVGNFDRSESGNQPDSNRDCVDIESDRNQDPRRRFEDRHDYTYLANMVES